MIKQNNNNIHKGTMDTNYHLGRLNKKSWSYRLRRRGSEVIRIIKKYSPEARSILDLGTADGLMLSRIKNEFPKSECLGIESSLELINLNKNPKIEIIQNDVENMDLNSDGFDVVIACALIEHIKNPEKMLAEIRRVLRHGGIIIITTPVPFYDKIGELLGAVPGEYHEKLYTLNQLQTLLRQSNFKILEKQKFMLCPAGCPGELKIEKLLHKLRLDFLMLNQLAVAQK